MEKLKRLKHRCGKRALAALALFSLLFTSLNLQTMLSFGGSEEESFDIGTDLECVLYGDGRLVISGNGGSSAYDKDTAPFLGFADRVRYLEIQDGVTSLGDYLFYGCGNLSGQLILPESLIHIGKSCFGGQDRDKAPRFTDVISLFEGGEQELPTATESNATPSDATPSDAGDLRGTDSDAREKEDPWSGPGLEAGFYKEQVIDGDIFCPGQSGRFYCLDTNESFRAAAQKAGYTDAGYGAKLCLSYGEGPRQGGMTRVCYYLLSAKPQTRVPKLPALYEPGEPDGLYEDVFMGWEDENGERKEAGTRISLSENIETYEWTALWERRPVDLIEEQTAVTGEKNVLRVFVVLRDVPEYELFCQWYVSEDYREMAEKEEQARAEASWQPIEGAVEPVYEREMTDGDETRYFTCEVTARKRVALGSVNRIAEESDQVGSQFSKPETLGLVPSVTAFAAVGKHYDGFMPDAAAWAGQTDAGVGQSAGGVNRNAVAVTGDSAVTVSYGISGMDAEIYDQARIDGDFPAGLAVTMTVLRDGNQKGIYYYTVDGSPQTSISLTKFRPMDGAAGTFSMMDLDRGDWVFEDTLVFVLDYRSADEKAEGETQCSMALVFTAGDEVEQTASETSAETEQAVLEMSAEAEWIRKSQAQWAVSFDQGEGGSISSYGKSPMILEGHAVYEAEGEDTRHEEGYMSLYLELYDESGKNPVDFPMGMQASAGGNAAKGIFFGNKCVLDLGKVRKGATPFTLCLDPGEWGFDTGNYLLSASLKYGEAPGTVEKLSDIYAKTSLGLEIHNPAYGGKAQAKDGRLTAEPGTEVEYGISGICMEDGGAKQGIWSVEVLKKGASGYEKADPAEGWEDGRIPGTELANVWKARVPAGASGTYRLRFIVTVEDPWRGTVEVKSTCQLIVGGS